MRTTTIHLFGLDIPIKDEEPAIVKEILWKAIINPYITTYSIQKMLNKFRTTGSSNYILKNLNEAEKQYTNLTTREELRMLTSKLRYLSQQHLYLKQNGSGMTIPQKLTLSYKDYGKILHTYPLMIKNGDIYKILDNLPPQILAAFICETVKGHKKAIEDIAQYFYEWDMYYKRISELNAIKHPYSKPKPICMMIGNNGIGKSLILQEAARLLNAELITIDCHEIEDFTNFNELMLNSLSNHLVNSQSFFNFHNPVFKDNTIETYNRKVIWHFENFEKVIDYKGFAIDFNYFMDEESWDYGKLMVPLNTLNITSNAFVLTANYDFIDTQKDLHVYEIANLLSGNGVHDYFIENLNDIIQLHPLTKEDIHQILEDKDESPMRFFHIYYKENNHKLLLSQEQKEKIIERALKAKPGIHILHMIIADVLRDEMLQIANK